LRRDAYDRAFRPQNSRSVMLTCSGHPDKARNDVPSHRERRDRPGDKAANRR